MERLNAIRVGRLDKWIRIMATTEILDPLTGGLVPGPPTLLSRVLGAIDPVPVGSAKEVVAGGGAITNVATSVITFWYVPGVTVNHYLEYDAVEYPTGTVVTTRRFDILEPRQVDEGFRMMELLCKERVS